MPKIDKVETDKRVRVVMEWILMDIHYGDIVTQICQKWGIEIRQAKRYIKEARKRWGQQEDELLEHKLRRKILSLNRLKNTLKNEFHGTPQGLRAVLAVEKEIINLEKMGPVKKVEVSTPDGPLVEQQIIYVKETNVDYTKLSDEVLEQIIKAKKQSE